MTPDSTRRALLAAACITTPVFGMVAALTTPALSGDPASQLLEVADAPGHFHLYAVSILISSLLLVPAVFALTTLVRPARPWAALIAGTITQIGNLVAIGDSASELVFWQLGAHGGDAGPVVAVVESYATTPGVQMIYNIGGCAPCAEPRR